MSKTTNKIIELLNVGEKVSNCCGADLVENSYTYEFNIESGRCSKCQDGCGVETIPELDSAGFDIDGNDHYHPNKYYNAFNKMFEGTTPNDINFCNDQELKGAKEWAKEYLSRNKVEKKLPKD